MMARRLSIIVAAVNVQVFAPSCFKKTSDASQALAAAVPDTISTAETTTANAANSAVRQMRSRLLRQEKGPLFLLGREDMREKNFIPLLLYFITSCAVVAARWKL